MSGPYLEVAGLTKTFGPVRVLETLDISVGKAELVTLLGPSGCGKTTLLRAIAGLERPDAGAIRLGGRDIAKVPAHKRDIGVVFQSYALFPHLTVAENVAFGLRARGMGKAARDAEVVRALDLVRMGKFADRRITALSGGQQQRVALARALAIRPSLMLFDEALSALDRKLREAMQIELKQLLRTLEFTAIFVSHDQDEALAMSDRIAVMNAGRIEQFEGPEALYRRPATPFVLDFVGLSTRLAGKVAGPGRVDTALGPVMAPTDLPVGTAVTVAVRPECFRVNDTSADNQAVMTVGDTMFLGARVIAFGTSVAGDRLLVELPQTPKHGEQIAIAWSKVDTLVFPA